jgi:predicted AAA+ superfamily ATPase
MAVHIPRYTDHWLEETLPHLRAIMIDGAKGVGKTRTAELFAKTILQLDDENIREGLAANYAKLYDYSTPILLDEWQNLPAVWNKVRRMVDDGIPEGSFILTGSLQSKDPSLHSGAGRIVRMRMRPLSLAERLQRPKTITLRECLAGSVPEKFLIESDVSFQQYMEEITRSGFPAIYYAPEGMRELLLDSYIENISSKDFSKQGIYLRQPDTLKRWMRSYAAAVGTTASYTKILDAATPGEDNKPAKTTTISYREALFSLWLIDDLPIWGDSEDFFGRLKQTPKHFLADPALEARLLGLGIEDLVTGVARTQYDPDYGSIAGRLFESLCSMSVRTYATSLGAQTGFLRTANGHREIDLIIQKNQDLVAIETKIGATVSDEDVRHLNWFEGKVGNRVKEKIILTTGDRAYRRKDRVLVIPAALFA